MSATSRFVLIVRETSCDLFRVVGRRITDLLSASGNTPQAAQVALIERLPSAQVTVIADFVADDYQRDRVLVRNPWDRSKLIARRVERVFPDLNLRGTVQLRSVRGTAAAPGTSYLLAGCASVPLLDAWLGVLAAGRWQVCGVGILALEVERIAAVLLRSKAATEPAGVLAVPRADRGLRLVARTSEGFVGTRIMSAAAGDPAAALADRRQLGAVASWAQELGGAARGQPRVVLVDPAGRSSDRPGGAGPGELEILGGDEVAGRLGLRGVRLEVGRMTESLVASYLGRFQGAPAIELRAAELVPGYQARVYARNAQRGAAAALVLGIVLAGVALELRSAQEQRQATAEQQIQQLRPSLAALRTKRAEFRKDFAAKATGTSPDLALSTLALNEEIGGETAKFLPNVAAFGKAFDQKVYVTRLTAGRPVPKAAPGGRAIAPPAASNGPLPYSFVVRMGQNAPPEQNLDMISAVRETLRKTVPLYAVAVSGYSDDDAKPVTTAVASGPHEAGPPPPPDRPGKAAPKPGADAAAPVEPSFQFTLTPGGA